MPRKKKTTKSTPSEAINPTANPSMKDIAKAAGVSIGTVSLALSNNPLCSNQTRERIHKLSAQMGYLKHPYICALMKTRRSKKGPLGSPTIAFLTFHDTRDGWQAPPYIDNFTPAAAEAERHGYHLEPFWANDPELSPARLRQLLIARGIRGIILNPPQRQEMEIKLELDCFSLISAGSGHPQLLTDRVTSDHFSIARNAVQTCINQGFKRIGLICRNVADQRLHRRWSSAYYGELHAAKLPTNIPPFMKDRYSINDLVDWFRRKKPDAVVGTLNEDNEDVIAELKIKKVISSDHCPYLSITLKRPGWISGFIEHYELSAATAVQQLIDMIHRGKRGIPKVSKVTFLHGEWNPGETFPENAFAPTARNNTDS
jgi:DNA-binding LacI/PurR family transcriptional regulator